MLNAEKHFIFSCGCSWTLRMLITSNLHLSSDFSSVYFYFGNRGPGRHTELKSSKYQQDFRFKFTSFYLRIICVGMLLDFKTFLGIPFSLYLWARVKISLLVLRYCILEFGMLHYLTLTGHIFIHIILPAHPEGTPLHYQQEHQRISGQRCYTCPPVHSSYMQGILR